MAIAQDRINTLDDPMSGDGRRLSWPKFPQTVECASKNEKFKDKFLVLLIKAVLSVCLSVRPSITLVIHAYSVPAIEIHDRAICFYAVSK